MSKLVIRTRGVLQAHRGGLPNDKKLLTPYAETVRVAEIQVGVEIKSQVQVQVQRIVRKYHSTVFSTS